MNHFPGFPIDWQLRVALPGGSHQDRNHYRNKAWREAGHKIRDWRVNPTLNALGDPIALRGDILHHIPIAERLARWKQSRSVFPMSRPRLK